jgi:chaperonin cofactor prefoldin
MPLMAADRQALQQAIDQLRSDIEDLNAELPTWENQNTSGTKKYRSISKRIVASAQRLEQLVRQHTY